MTESIVEVMNTLDQALVDSLSQVVSGISQADTYYVVASNYYDHQTPERFGERWYIAQIWLSHESAWNVALTETGLLCEVKLNRHDLSQISRILLPYDQIWSIQHVAGNRQVSLYHRSDKLNLRLPDEAD